MVDARMHGSRSCCFRDAAVRCLSAHLANPELAHQRAAGQGRMERSQTSKIYQDVGSAGKHAAKQSSHLVQRALCAVFLLVLCCIRPLAARGPAPAAVRLLGRLSRRLQLHFPLQNQGKQGSKRQCDCRHPHALQAALRAPPGRGTVCSASCGQRSRQQSSRSVCVSCSVQQA